MEYGQAQEEYREKTKVKLQNQLQIATGKEVNESDVDEMLKKGDIKVFIQDVCIALVCCTANVIHTGSGGAEVISGSHIIVHVINPFYSITL